MFDDWMMRGISSSLSYWALQANSQQKCMCCGSWQQVLSLTPQFSLIRKYYSVDLIWKFPYQSVIERQTIQLILTFRICLSFIPRLPVPAFYEKKNSNLFPIWDLFSFVLRIILSIVYYHADTYNIQHLDVDPCLTLWVAR